jgi:hypothetical protein
VPLVLSGDRSGSQRGEQQTGWKQAQAGTRLRRVTHSPAL